MKNKILVTGGGGYIGSVAVYLLLKHDYEVVVIDNFSTGYRQPLELLQQKFGEKQLRFYQADLRDNLDPIFQKERQIDAAIHYAASCLVDESMQHPERYFANNVGGSQHLLETLIKHDIKKLVFSSTCAVYGEAEHVPVDEKHPTRPNNPYGESKRMVESMINWHGRLQGLNYVVLRYFNVCGASDDGLIGDSKHPSVLLVQNAVRGALGIQPFFLTCPTVATPDKTPIRDYINVVDLNLAHLKALDYLFHAGKSDIVNLGTGQGNSVLEIVKAVQQLTGKKFKLQSTTPRQGEYAKMIAAIARAKTVLGWQPQRTIKDSIASLVSWYRRHPNGWKA